MKTNHKQDLIARIGRGSLGLPALLALMLSAVGVGRAQSSATPAPAAQVGRANPAVPAGQTAPKGQHEGITVHGHWVIEVKNPDGTVTARREFENNVQPVGENYLVALLSGNNSPGGLSILLNGAHAVYPANEVGSVPFPLAFSQSDLGPCVPFSTTGVGGFQSGGASGGTTCLLASATSYLGGLCFRAQVVSSTNSTSSPALAASPCSNNLKATGNIFTEIGGALGQAPQLTLSGTVTATTSLTGQMVTDVESVFTTCDGGSTPLNCNNIFDLQTATASSTPGNVVGVNLFTLRPLDGNTTAGAAAGDPNPVSYTPGQIISVTVTFSFQ